MKEPGNIALKTWSTTPTQDYDAPKPGTIMVGFEVVMPAAGAKGALTVLLIPASAKKGVDEKIKPLNNGRGNKESYYSSLTSFKNFLRLSYWKLSEILNKKVYAHDMFG